MRDNHLPSPVYSSDNGKTYHDVDCLEWWQNVESQYDILFKMVSAVLSIFHGPKVPYSSIQDVKYALKARAPNEDEKSVNIFHRENRLFSPVNPILSKSMRNSSRYMRESQNKKKVKNDEKKRKYQVTTGETAKKLKPDAIALAEKSKKEHQILKKA